MELLVGTKLSLRLWIRKQKVFLAIDVKKSCNLIMDVKANIYICNILLFHLHKFIYVNVILKNICRWALN